VSLNGPNPRGAFQPLPSLSLRASVGSTEASDGRLARVGVVGPKQDNGEVTHLQNTAKNKLDNPALLCILCI